MPNSKTMDRIVCAAVAVMLVLTAVVWTGKSAAGRQSSITMGYEGLFDQNTVHTIDIEISDWDSFIDTATQETYAECSVTIDGEKISGVGIRGKGNTSLSSVSSMGSRKYSFKIEFDQFQKGKSYHGLDKLSLNNLIYDATMMKDYLAYTLMNREGVPAPLCSYAQITVNGEPWGLYLAVEGVEDGFMERNNMTTGELYKPDSMSFGGGRGNGRDFDFEQFRVKDEESDETTEEESDAEPSEADTAPSSSADGFGGAFGNPPDPSSFGGFSGQMPSGMTPPEGFSMPEGMSFPGGFQPSEGTGVPEGFSAPDGADASETAKDAEGSESGSSRSRPGRENIFSFGGGMFNFGMGSSDVKLQYIDDDPDSYSNIFNNAKTKIGKKDKTRLIETLRTLNSENAQDAVYTDEVIRYLAVHDFLQNGDSYTGMMVHNYYLYEEDGRLAIIPWDYNLAFGGMGGGGDATSTVNSPIDTPVSNGSAGDRPLISWILTDEEALQKYHETYDQFLADTVESGWLANEIARVAEMIRPYVEADENSFYTAEEFDTAVETIQNYCALRGESIRGQLNGTIPSTSDGQRQDSSALVDAGDLSINAMGSMNNGNGGGNGPGGMPGGFSGPSGGGSFSMPGGFSKPGENGGSQSADSSGAQGFGGFGGGQMPGSGDGSSFSMPGGGSFPMPGSSGNPDESGAQTSDSAGTQNFGAFGGGQMPGGEGDGTFPMPGGFSQPGESGSSQPQSAAGGEAQPEETAAGETGKPADESQAAEKPASGSSDRKPGSSGRERQGSGRSQMPPGDFMPDGAMTSGNTTTGWIIFGAGILVLLAAVFIVSRLKGHNE